MGLQMSYATLRWQEPNLPKALTELKKAGWEGWEARAPLDWLGTPRQLLQVCEDAGMPLVVYTASGSPDQRDWAHVERNKRRIEFAAEMGASCFMFMSGPKAETRMGKKEQIEVAAEGAEAWATYAAQYDLELSYHIHTNTLVDSITDWKYYMSRLERTKLCIDVSHAALWGYDPVQAIGDFWPQLNYVHLQDYSSCTQQEAGRYNPVWVDVGQANCLDFPGVLATLVQRGFTGWVTCVPGDDSGPPGEQDPVSQAQRSAGMRSYLYNLGY